MRYHFILPVAIALSSALAAATPAPPKAKAEIDALLTALQTSGCEFNRNGSWYSGTEAKAHLAKKLDYLEGKSAITTTEQFIDLGASGSSMSGKPYQVRCGAAAPVSSKQWLLERLKVIRNPAK